MAFDAKGFSAAIFEHRTEAVSVPGMGQWFDAEPVWTVRGLTAHEFAHCNDAATRDGNVAALLEAFGGKSHASKVKELRAALGLVGDVPGEVRKRIEMLVIASIDPVCERELAVKVAERYPIEFYQLTNAVVSLTGQGQVAPGKSEPSGTTEK